MEFAIVAPVLALLIFGVIDFGFLYYRQIAVRSGVRAATREAVIARFGHNDQCPTEGLSTTSQSVRLLVCNTKAQIALDPKTTRVRIRLIDGNGDGKAEHKSYDDVMVCAMAGVKSMTGFFQPLFTGKAYRSRLEMLIEKGYDEVPNMVLLQDAQETPLPGQNWNFCDPDTPAP